MRPIVLLLLAAACDDLPEEELLAPPPAPAAHETAAAAAVGPDGPEQLDVPELGAPSEDPAMIARGEEVFAARGCGGCHAFGSKLVGPDLVGVTERRSVTWM